MKVIVLGAGVVGITTAYCLARHGCAVTVIDRRNELAAEASYANGGQLSYDFASPMGSPGVLRRLADYLLGRDEAFKISLTAEPAFLSWGCSFLANCLPSNTRRNAERLASLAQDSEKSLKHLIKETGIGFDYRKSGKLVLFDSAGEFSAAAKRAQSTNCSDRNLIPLDKTACLKLEPALRGWRGASFVGGLYAPNDEVGDARLFANAIGALASKRYGVEFVLGRTVNAIQVRKGIACGVSFDGGDLDVDAIVVCMGVNAPRLLRPLGVAAPIQPIRGYSITAPAKSGAPQVAITDLGRKMVFSRIGANMRVAGFADAGPQSPEIAQGRIQALVHRAQSTLPQAADYLSISSKWVGVRPSTPNSLPIVGESKVRRLFLNIGHGMFGWTLSAASAEKIVREVISGKGAVIQGKAA